jgi:DNA-formamidopyrimidine glycosylase
MPEGPEVTILTENLNYELKDKIIENFEISSTSRYRNKAPDNFIDFKENLPLKIKRVKNKGKLIYFLFSNDFSLINTLGMSGGWSKTKGKHTSVTITLKGGKKYYFIDVRHFGTFKFFNTKDELENRLNKLGPDMLNDKDLTSIYFIKRLRKYKHYNICKAIMDQKIICGVGNYLKSESLYHAKINPLMKVEDLTTEDLERLFKSIRKKIKESYLSEGVSVRDFSDLDDKKGKYQFYFEVYCQKKDTKGRKVVKIVTPDKRSTYYVPEVQI